MSKYSPSAVSRQWAESYRHYHRFSLAKHWIPFVISRKIFGSVIKNDSKTQSCQITENCVILFFFPKFSNFVLHDAPVYSCRCLVQGPGGSSIKVWALQVLAVWWFSLTSKYYHRQSNKKANIQFDSKQCLICVYSRLTNGYIYTLYINYIKYCIYK